MDRLVLLSFHQTVRDDILIETFKRKVEGLYYFAKRFHFKTSLMPFKYYILRKNMELIIMNS